MIGIIRICVWFINLFFGYFKENEQNREYVENTNEEGNVKETTLAGFNVAKDLAFINAFRNINYFRSGKAKRTVTWLTIFIVSKKFTKIFWYLKVYFTG